MANDLEPVTSALLSELVGFVRCEAINAEYGPGQLEVNIPVLAACEAADTAVRLRYGVREIARRQGVRATFMAKPFHNHSGSSSHLHISLWQDGAPAFVSSEGAENELMRRAIGGMLAHLQGITLLGAPTVNSYKRFEPGSFAPSEVGWGGDNRSAAIRSLVGLPAATRVELRTPASDANPYWAIAAALAAIVAGIEDDADPGQRGDGLLYGTGTPLPRTLAEAVSASRRDARVTELLGAAAVADVQTMAEAEWRAFTTEVSQWDLDRYLEIL